MFQSRNAKRARSVAVALALTFALNYAISYAAKPSSSSSVDRISALSSGSTSRSGNQTTPATPPK